MSGNRLFFFPGYERYVLFTAPALAHIYKWKQRYPWSKEAGGELFAPNPGDGGLVITTAKGPTKEDYRTRHTFVPDVEASFQERRVQYAQDLHPVGLWHTHPQKWPTPSELDRQTTKEYLEGFEGDRQYFLMVILGVHGNPVNMTVGAETTLGWVSLTEEAFSSVTFPQP